MDYINEGNPANAPEERNPNKCKEPFCGAILDWRYDYEEICNSCHNKEEEEEEEEEETQNK